MTSGPTHQKMAADIWAVADLLRGDYKRHEYGQVILPFMVLRRLDAVMAPTREAVRARDTALDIQNKQRPLELAAKLPFYNTSRQDFTTIAADASQVAKNLRDYINGFSQNVREILSRFALDNQITRLAESKILYQVVGKFATIHDLDKLSNHDMGYVFEHLIRKFYPGRKFDYMLANPPFGVEAARRRAYRIITDPARDEALARLRAEMARETGGRA